MEFEDLTCPLCLDLFNGNVRITKCGHSICEKCLKRMISSNEDFYTHWFCPVCRMEQTETLAEMTRNYALERSVVKYKASKINICCTHNLQKKYREYFNHNFSSV